MKLLWYFCETRRVSPIHSHLVSHGAFMSLNAGWESPDWYSEEGKAPAEYRPSFRRWIFDLLFRNKKKYCFRERECSPALFSAICHSFRPCGTIRLARKKNTATAKFAPKKFFYGFFPVFRTNWHSAVLKEHTAVTNNVGLKDLSTFAKFRVKSGPKTSERNKLFLKKNNFKGIH